MSQFESSFQPAQSPQARHFPAVFWGLLALTAAVRLIGVGRPLLGNFATKNCVYAMIARNWAEGRAAGLFYPTLDLYLLKGDCRSWHMLEFPVSAYLSGGLWKVLGGSLEVWGRSTAVAFSVGSVALMFLFVRRRHGHSAATAAGFVLALSPLSIIYGQSFMLDASLVFFTLATFYGLDRWLAAGRLGWLLTATVCLALLLLTKVYMLVLLLPLGYMAFRSQRCTRRGYATVLVAAAVAILPVALWSGHALRTAAPDSPSAAQVYTSLQGNLDGYGPPDPLLWVPDFYRRVLDNLTGVVLTPVGFMLLLAGILDRRWRQYGVWLVAMVVLVVALPRKFHEMNYYYMVVLPPLCIMAGLGWQVIQQRVRPGRAAVAGLLLVALLLSFRYALRPALVTPEEDRGVLAAARELQRLTAEDEPVVTMHGTGIDLLYYSRRPGWAVPPDEPELEAVLEDCRRRGARYVVVVGEGPILQSLVSSGDNFRIHRLSAEESP